MKINHMHKAEMVTRLGNLSTEGLTPDKAKIRALQTKLWFAEKNNRELLESASVVEKMVLFFKQLKPRTKDKKIAEAVNAKRFSPEYN